MKKLITILFLIFISILTSHAQWVTQSSGTTEHLYDVFFIDTSTGWASGNNGTMLKTIDGGSYWFALNSGINDRPLNSVFFINQNTGWSCTSLISIAGLIIKTTNGGNNWFVQHSSPNKSYFAIFFIDSLRGWAPSSGVDGWVFRTTNGGNSWDSVSILTGAARSVQFINPQTGWLALGSGIYKSTNGGTNWFIQFDNIGYGEITSISFPDINTGYALSLELWRVYKTTNSGNNWTYLSAFPICFNAHCIFFRNVNTGWASGDCGQLFSTTNGGFNWYQHVTNTNSFLQSTVFVTDSIGWAVGGAGRIIHTSSGGQIASVTAVNNEAPLEFMLYQNYPNPFNPVTKIKFDVSPDSRFRGNDNVTLKVYDILGREIAVLVNEQLNTGTYEVEWNASGFPSGIYFYRIYVGSFTETRRIVLMK